MSTLQKQQDGEQKNVLSGGNVLPSERQALPDNLEDAHKLIRHLLVKLSQCINNISRLEQSTSRLEQSIVRLEQAKLETSIEALNAFD